MNGARSLRDQSPILPRDQCHPGEPPRGEGRRGEEGDWIRWRMKDRVERGLIGFVVRGLTKWKPNLRQKVSNLARYLVDVVMFCRTELLHKWYHPGIHD